LYEGAVRSAQREVKFLFLIPHIAINLGLQSHIWAPQTEASIITRDLITKWIKIKKRYIQIVENSNNYLLNKELFNKYFQLKHSERKLSRCTKSWGTKINDIVTCTLLVNIVNSGMWHECCKQYGVCLQPSLGNGYARNNGAAVEVFSLESVPVMTSCNSRGIGNGVSLASVPRLYN
jgi:hypothetical protein